MKSATGTAVVFFILIECRANFTDPSVMPANWKQKSSRFCYFVGI